MRTPERLRVHTEAQQKQLYADFSSKLELDARTLFFLCACLGYASGSRQPLEKRDERFFSGTIDSTEWACYCAFAMRDAAMDIGAIRDPKEVLALAEEYANAGFTILTEEILREHIEQREGQASLDLPKDGAAQALNELVFELIQRCPAQDR